MANMKDVAEKAGVSVATVSHVINKTRHVSEPTRKKVLESMKELNYSPNKIARSLRKKETKTIGFIVPDISNFFFTGIANHIEQELNDNAYNVILCNSNEDIEQEKNQLQTLNSYQIDGVIIAPAPGDHSYLYESSFNQDYPLVFIDRKPQNYNCTSVLVNNFESSYNAVRKLIDKGHNKIGIITGLSGITTTLERLKGYKKALKDHNIPVNDNYIFSGDSKFQAGYNSTKKLLKKTDITALYVTNNLMCIGAVDCLNEHSVSIPEELAIIGFDDYKWASITDPPLSVISQPIEELGKTAVKKLMEYIEGVADENEKPQEIRLDTKFIERASC